MNKLEKVHQICGGKSQNTDRHDFVKKSKKSCIKHFGDKTSLDLTNFVQSGKNFFLAKYFCFEIVYFIIIAILIFTKPQSNKIYQNNNHNES